MGSRLLMPFFDSSRSERHRASPGKACVVGDLGKQGIFAVFATGRKDVETSKTGGGAQKGPRFPVFPVQGGYVLRPMIYVTDAHDANTLKAGLWPGTPSERSAREAASVRGARSHGPRRRVAPSTRRRNRGVAGSALARERVPRRTGTGEVSRRPIRSGRQSGGIASPAVMRVAVPSSQLRRPSRSRPSRSSRSHRRRCRPDGERGLRGGAGGASTARGVLPVSPVPCR